ncbi:TIGR02453 family protein [Chitinophagaceae bacterium IBVUCB1]|nr:TIGR02453 family protein [Chitinophagaceae bacterium IBVUCB1]
MLQQATIEFLKKLEKNNNKEWFDKNRHLYEAAKADFETFVTSIHTELTKLEPRLAEHKAKDAIFRIFRDVRFAKDKTPYKANFGAYFCRAGKKAPDAGFYMHLQPNGKSFLAGGMWMPEAPVLKKVRQELDYNFDEFKGIINKASFKKLFKKWEGEKLKTLPQGYTADNPAIEFLKMKSVIVSVPVDDADYTSKTAVAKMVKTFTEMKPLIDFLNRAID